MRAFAAQRRLVPVAGPMGLRRPRKHRKNRAFRKCRPRKPAKTRGFRRMSPRTLEKPKTRKNTCFRAAGPFGVLDARSKKHAKTRAFGRRASKRHAKTRAFSRVLAENTQKHVKSDAISHIGRKHAKTRVFGFSAPRAAKVGPGPRPWTPRGCWAAKTTRFCVFLRPLGSKNTCFCVFSRHPKLQRAVGRIRARPPRLPEGARFRQKARVFAWFCDSYARNARVFVCFRASRTGRAPQNRPMVDPGCPEATPKGPPGTPKGPEGTPKGLKGTPKGL